MSVVLRQGAVADRSCAHLLVDTDLVKAAARPQLWPQVVAARWRQPTRQPTTTTGARRPTGGGGGRRFLEEEEQEAAAEDADAEQAKHRRR